VSGERSMSDEFLHRLRRDPPAEFAARLKRRLERQATAGARSGTSPLRLLIVALVLGATAFAVTTITLRGGPLVIVRWLQGVQPADNASGARDAPAPARTGDARTTSRVAPGGYGATAPSRSNPAEAASAGRPALATDSAELRDSERAGPASTAAHSSIRIAASSLAYPFALVMAGDLARTREKDADLPQVDRYQVPDRALIALCDGYEADVAFTSARMGAGYLLRCTQNRLDVVEVKLGYEALVLARSAAAGAPGSVPAEISLAHLYTLLTSPDPSWNQIDPTREPERIEFVGPPLTAVASDRITELLLLPGCRSYVGALASNGSSVSAVQCRTVLEQYAEKDSVIRALVANPSALGILDYTSYARNADRLVAMPLQSARPTYEQIASGAYPASRAIYLYLKKAEVLAVPQLRRLVELAVSDALVGPSGDLTGLGLIPLQNAEGRAVRADALALHELKF
jgi:phosphate transport system substrate-binding protein